MYPLRQSQRKHMEHNVRWHFDWRQLFADKNTCFNVREHSGHSLKSSLEHVFTLNTQDNDILPTRGVLFKLANELAGFQGTGDVRFVDKTIITISVYGLLDKNIMFKKRNPKADGQT